MDLDWVTALQTCKAVFFYHKLKCPIAHIADS